MFNSLFGWQNSATYGSVISYNVYWIAVIAGFLGLRYNEKSGHWPLMKAKSKPVVERKASDTTSKEEGVAYQSEVIGEKKMQTSVSSASS